MRVLCVIDRGRGRDRGTLVDLMTGLKSDSWHGRGYVVAVLSQMREEKRKIGPRSESLDRGAALYEVMAYA